MATKDTSHLEIVTTEFRASHPHIFTPTQMKVNGKLEGKANYSIEMLFDKETTTVADLQKPLFLAAKEKWGSKDKWPEGLKFPIRDGDKPYGKNKEVKPEHKGMYVVKASSSGEFKAPLCVNKNNQPILDAKEFYPGVYAVAGLKAHAYTFADKDGVKFILQGVKKLRDGKPMGSGKTAEQLFGAMSTDDVDDFDADSEDSFL